jgi:hypothetical protein
MLFAVTRLWSGQTCLPESYWNVLERTVMDSNSHKVFILPHWLPHIVVVLCWPTYTSF